MKREREPVNQQPQVANQPQVGNIEDLNQIKDEHDVENNEIQVTYESHPRTKEAIEAAEEMNKLTMMKQKKRKLEMEKEKIQEEEQALDDEIQEQRAKVMAKI